jgi:hypothetical protein
MVTLSSEDFNRLVDVITRQPAFNNASTRIGWIHDVLRESPRAAALRGSLNLGGMSPRLDAITLVQYLTRFGQDEPGREVIARLLNGLLVQPGDEDDAAFLRGLFAKYPLG